VSSSIKSSSSELDEVSDMMWLLLPSELEICIFSWLPIIDQREFVVCSAIPNSPFLLPGIFIALDPMVGDESGEACSARVEWCRLVAAREKSSPLDRLGRMFVGDAYVCE